MAQKSGIVAIAGRPNVGKSTLLNAILGQKVAIVSKVPQTTRITIRGILNGQKGQVVFLDTPGIHLPKNILGESLLAQVREAIVGSDCILHLVDTSRAPGQEENMALREIVQVKKPVVLGLNKIDLGGRFLPDYIRLWEESRARPVAEQVDSLILIPLSGLKKINLDRLVDCIFSFLPEGGPLYPPDRVCDLPVKFFISDIIREKLLDALRQEIPHCLAVSVEEIVERSKNLTYIKAEILVERESQKAIVIGKRANVLKEVGKISRREIEGLLEKKVYLELSVKVKRGWRQEASLLERLGYRV
jgi:GTP-binding protein Era